MLVEIEEEICDDIVAEAIKVTYERIKECGDPDDQYMLEHLIEVLHWFMPLEEFNKWQLKNA